MKEDTNDAPMWSHTISDTDGTVTIALAGELDVSCVETLKVVMLEHLQSSSVGAVIVDLAQVEFLDSTILGVLVSAYRSASMSGHGFTVVNPSPFAHRLLSVTGLLDVFVTV